MKIIFKILLSIFLVISVSIIYLSTIGVETSRFNNQIASLIKNFNKELKIELNQVKIILDPFNLQINVKTIGPKLLIKDKSIELESVKTQIILDTLLNDNFSLKNLDISTKSLEIENLISFSRILKNTPELYILEKILKKGYLICDVNLEFDEKGNIKDNYKIRGSINDAQIKFLKKYDINNINFNFNFANRILDFTNLVLFLNYTQLLSKKITIEDVNDSFSIYGSVENQNLNYKNKFLNYFLKNNFPKIDVIDVNLNSKNKFSFLLDKKFNIDKFKLLSEIEIINMKLVNNFDLKDFFPNIRNEINLSKHLININYDKNEISLVGKGNLNFQDKNDYVSYNFLKKKDTIDFKTNLVINQNPIYLNFLDYKKEPNTKAEINFNGSHTFDKETIINSLSYIEKKNKIEIDQLFLKEDFKIINVEKVYLEYFDSDLRENKITILKKNKKNRYNIVGSKFNANNLIEDLISSDSNELNIFDQSFDLNIKINQVYLDKENIINDLKGNLNFKKNELMNGELNGSFSKNEQFKFTVKTNKLEKVTTLYLDKAQPLVKRYKFIKGFKGGSIDFYSSKKGEKSFSNLKIYDFRLQELPILTKLLTLASLQGIADILSGEGITFDEFEMNFDNQNKLMTINELYAIGPAISILMDGYVEKNKLISLRGSLVPATTINKAIGNIPVLGKILVGSKTGEGVFGVSFKIKGPPGKLETTVNPIKTLTPRFITRTLEKIKKN